MSNRDPENKGKLKYGKFFMDWLNQRCGFDYKAILNLEEDSDVDIYLKSKRGYPRINLQLTTPDEEIIHNEIKNPHKPIDYDLVGWISNAITKKENKYPPEQRYDLVLLLHTSSPPFLSGIEEVKKLQPAYSKTVFKGIYYVFLPTRSWPQEEYLKKGACLVLKDISPVLLI